MRAASWASGKVGPEGQVDAEETDPLVVGRVRFEIFSHAIEVAAADEDAVGGGERVVQKAEVRRAGERVLVDRERVERGLAEGGHGQQKESEGAHDPRV